MTKKHILLSPDDFKEHMTPHDEAIYCNEKSLPAQLAAMYSRTAANAASAYCADTGNVKARKVCVACEARARVYRELSTGLGD